MFVRMVTRVEMRDGKRYITIRAVSPKGKRAKVGADAVAPEDVPATMEKLMADLAQALADG